MHHAAVLARRRRALQWDALAAALVCLLATGAGVPQAAPPPIRSVAAVDADREWRFGDVVVTYAQPAGASGLAGAVLQVTEGGRSRAIGLDGTRTAARARRLAGVRHLPGHRRLVLQIDPEHDRSGLLVVDLATDTVVDALIGHDFTASPDGRFWAFQEYASLIHDQWPHTETVYAVYDAAAVPGQPARACPAADERCRGEVLFLPDRLTRCHEIARETAGACLVPGRQPAHERRSPFVWLGERELAWVDVDRDRQVSTLVIVGLTEGRPADVRALPLERERVIEDVDFPPARQPWTIEGITRDADPSRVWLQFRTRIPQAPRQRLGVRLS